MPRNGAVDGVGEFNHAEPSEFAPKPFDGGADGRIRTQPVPDIGEQFFVSEIGVWTTSQSGKQTKRKGVAKKAFATAIGNGQEFMVNDRPVGVRARCRYRRPRFPKRERIERQFIAKQGDRLF